jgi:ribosome biogenesis GTPase
VDKTKRRVLTERLESMDNNERQKLHKRAAKLLKASQKTQGPRDRQSNKVRIQSWNEDGDRGSSRRMRSTSDSVQDLMLELLDEEQPEIGMEAVDENAETHEGVVVSLAPRTAVIRVGDGDVDCILPPFLAQAQQTEIAVGDNVLIVERGSDFVVTEVLPRKTQLSRPDPDNAHRERLIAANVDVIVIVASVRTPPLRPRLIDRYLIAISRGGAQPVLCVNKLDLLKTEEEREAEIQKLEPYRAIDIPILECSTKTGNGIDALREALKGRVCAFVGHSGVGKSSLLNALDPGLELRTNTLRDGDGKGRHTTTGSTLYELVGGTKVIDTPGIRGFGLWNIGAEELHAHFPEFEDAAAECRFSDCTHAGEPGCGVVEAVASGSIPTVRFDAYLRILKSIEA